MKESVRVVEARKVDLVFQTSDGPVHALSEIDLEINKGEFVSLIRTFWLWKNDAVTLFGWS